MSNEQENELLQVLVADDDPAILRYVEKILEKEGYAVVTTRDGREAYKMLSSREPFAAAILDVSMPYILGTDLVKHMKSDRRLMTIPVIMMTAEQNARLLPEVYKSGAAAFIPKPFTVSQLQAMLRLFVQKDASDQTTNKKSASGMSAIELLIAMAIFLVVMTSVYGILQIGNKSRTTINSRSENIKNVRMAINSIGREAVNAGLGYNRIGGSVPDDFTTENFKLPADGDKDIDLLTAISSGYNIAESDLSKNGEKNDVVAFAFRDFQFNDGFPVIINDISQNGDRLILKTPDGACAKCRPFDLFLIETGEGKQAVILSTDIVNNNQIVLDGDKDQLNINYGKATTTSSGTGNNGGDDDDDDNSGPGSSGSGGTNRVERSTIKKCKTGQTENCINYGSSTVVLKKIYLVSYGVSADGTLIRTTYGNNTGGGAKEQILRQPIANGIRSFKVKYLLSDGTVTEDPSVANTQKENCNNIVQIEVTVMVESETSLMGTRSSDPIELTSTFSTRNLKYDVY